MVMPNMWRGASPRLTRGVYRTSTGTGLPARMAMLA